MQTFQTYNSIVFTIKMSFIPRWNQKWHPQKKFYGIEKDYHQVHYMLTLDMF